MSSNNTAIDADASACARVQAFLTIHAITKRSKSGVHRARAAFLENPAEFIVNSLSDHAGYTDGILVGLVDEAETLAGLLCESIENSNGSIYNARGAYLLNQKLNLAKQIAGATHEAALEFAKGASWNPPSTLPKLPLHENGGPAFGCPELVLWVRSAADETDGGYTVTTHEWLSESDEARAKLAILGWIALPSRAVGVRS